MHYESREIDMSVTKDDFEHTGSRLFEREPLLRPAPLPSAKKAPNVTSTVLWISLLRSFLELEQGIQFVPTVRLLESAICQQHYNRPVHEKECKIDSISRKVAWILGWQASLDAVLGISCFSSTWCRANICLLLIKAFFFSIPFGYLADCVGRRPVVFLSELGEVLYLGFVLIICKSTDMTGDLWCCI